MRKLNEQDNYATPGFITSYILDEFMRFPTVEDHIIEYVPNVMIKKENGGRYFAMRNVENKSDDHTQILTTFNGMVWSPEQVLDYNPANIQKIEVCQSQFQFGNVLYGGGINFITYPDHIVDTKKNCPFHIAELR